MAHVLNVYALPKYVDPEELAGGTAVVIDVLRASTTIVHALEAGATEVIPCQEVEEARAVARGLPGDDVLLGGERGGLPVDGFDLGNSPREYIPHRVGGKTIVFTTTSGTRAILHARRADRVLIGAFVNATAVIEQLLGQERIHLLCAGTRGQITREDVLLAGLLVDRIRRQGGLMYEENAQAMTARETWLQAFALPKAIGAEPLEAPQLAEQLRDSLGGQNLIAIALEDDILAAARIDRFHSVPELDLDTGRIRLMDHTDDQ
ncbi:MAG: 2-phosphosulfolactate phosphatase [Planctomycetota bacterium]|jgi:2-phosphosulfolactate phosphatase